MDPNSIANYGPAIKEVFQDPLWQNLLMNSPSEAPPPSSIEVAIERAMLHTSEGQIRTASTTWGGARFILRILVYLVIYDSG